MSRNVLVLNSAYYPINVVNHISALNKIFENKAYVVEYYDRVIRSVSQEFKLPAVIVITEYSKFRNVVKYSKEGVKVRDQYRCAYCGHKFKSRELTIDHIIPKSRYNNKETANSWENCISSCFDCNSRKKKNRTPEEAGMPLLFQPIVPKYGVDYFESWNGEVCEQWLPYLPKRKQNIDIKFDGEVKDPKFGRKVIR